MGCCFQVFVFWGLMLLVFKGYRMIYVLLSFESIVLGVIMFYIPMVGVLSFIFLVVLSVVSSVIGFLIISTVMSSFGSDLVLL